MKKLSLTVVTENEGLVELLEAIAKVLMKREANIRWSKRFVPNAQDVEGDTDGSEETRDGTVAGA